MRGGMVLVVALLMVAIFVVSSSEYGIEEPKFVADQAMETYGALPLVFEPNKGQTDSRVEFLSRGRGYGLYLTPTEAILVLARTADNNDPASIDTGTGKDATLQMNLTGAGLGAKLVGVNPLEGRSNYFIGKDTDKWLTGVEHFGGVKYEEVYQGVDLIFYGNSRQLEYDFVVAPGADPERIQLQFEGAETIALDEDGNLVLQTGVGEVIQKAPVVYQELEGERKGVEGSYALLEQQRIAFTIGDYDEEQPLVIDPVLVYSTFLGGSSWEEARGIAVDSAGNAYVTGWTLSNDFPTENPLQGNSNGSIDVFVSKLNAEGTALVYSTYLGGQDSDQALGIAVDVSGHAYISGVTMSNDFPTQNPLQGSPGGNSDVFVSKLNTEGNALVYSTYIGGSIHDEVRGIAVDGDGSAVIGGITSSPDFPTQNPIQGVFGGGFDVFASKLNPEGSGLVYSTYLGGGDQDEANGIVVDAIGHAYVTGNTYSDDFPTLNPIQGSNGGYVDAFVSKLDVDGIGMVYSTYLGGDYEDLASGIAVDAAGNAYITGYTYSDGFPTQNALQDSRSGGVDVFVSKLNAEGTALVYSTYLGGSSSDTAYGLDVDSTGNVYVAGMTASTDFPTRNPFQTSNKGIGDVFVSKINAEATTLLYSTYLGGSNSEKAYGIVVDASDNAYVTGVTGSTDFPTRNPIQVSLGVGVGYGDDAFVTKFYFPDLWDELAVDFGSEGLFHYQTAWTRSSIWDPEALEAWQSQLAVDFGNNRGLFLTDSSGWIHLTGWDPYLLNAWNDKLAIGFDAGRGLFLYDGGWEHLTIWEPARVAAWEDHLAVDFGAGRGVFSYDGNWTHLTTWAPYVMAPWGDKLAFAFDNGRGLFLYDGQWTALSTWEPENLVAWYDRLVVDFGAGRGLFLYDSITGWQRISTGDPQQLLSWGEKLVVVLDSGVYTFQAFAGFRRLSTWIPERMAALEQMLVLDFGPDNGMYVYDGEWTSISSWSCEDLEPLSLYP